MRINRHLCGVAIAYHPNTAKKGPPNPFKQATPNDQGSLVNYQKRQISNACEWLRNAATHKARIFVATTSPNWGPDIYQPQISKFAHNLRNGYACENYLWVREFQDNGAPHYHFIADMPYISDPVALSLYWSGLFGYRSRNCVRLGTKPIKGRRTYFLKAGDNEHDRQMSFYMSKYLGKGLRKQIFNSWHSASMPGRNFGISQEVGRISQPITFEANYFFQEQPGQVLTASGAMVQAPSICTGVSYQNDLGEYFNKSEYLWQKCKDHSVWFGRKK